jgi:hypothetical protein
MPQGTYRLREHIARQIVTDTTGTNGYGWRIRFVGNKIDHADRNLVFLTPVTEKSRVPASSLAESKVGSDYYSARVQTVVQYTLYEFIGRGARQSLIEPHSQNTVRTVGTEQGLTFAWLSQQHRGARGSNNALRMRMKAHRPHRQSQAIGEFSAFSQDCLMPQVHSVKGTKGQDHWTIDKPRNLIRLGETREYGCGRYGRDHGHRELLP